MNFTVLKCFNSFLISIAYFDRLRSMLFLRLVSYPTVNSSIYSSVASLTIKSRYANISVFIDCENN